MGFVAKRIEAARRIDQPRIKRWIVTYGPTLGGTRRRRWLLQQRLVAKAQQADLGATTNTRGMSDDRFLALLRR